MKLLALALVIAAPALAFADDPDPDMVRSDMTAITAAPDVCTTLHKDFDEKAKCKPTAHAKLAGGATADLYTATDGPDGAARFAIVITSGDKVVMSPPIELEGNGCGMNKCDLLDGQTAKLHAIAGGTEVAAEVTGRFIHTSTATEPNAKPQVTEKWSTFDALVCNATQCFTRHRGARGNSCTGSISTHEMMTTRCDETSYIDKL